MNSVESLTSQLKALGFEEHPHNPHFCSAPGSKLPGVAYLCRKTGTLREYVSLMFYEGKFCEGCYEFFYTEKNTYLPKGRVKVSELLKKGFKDLSGALFRSEKEMLDLVQTDSQYRLTKADDLFNNLLKSKE